ncbi:molybdopterin-dependent oxidoreductase [Nocardia sp. NPDC046473]|uniref:molybdopterin-dependent oxidoreductase n=1 Tax=Nocardia sp. NPDC046473 TaxID=3155733 RepID=UPI0033FDED9C
MKQRVAQARPKPARSISAAALAGVLAALTVLGVGHLVAALIDPAASPFYAMGSAVVDHTPHALKDAAIRRFGSNDKLALFASMAAVMLIFAAILGISERRRPVGSAGLILLGGVVLGAALQRPTATPWFALPTAIGVAAGVLALRVLIGRAVIPAQSAGAAVSSDKAGDEGSAVPEDATARAGQAVGGTAARGNTAAWGDTAGQGDTAASAGPLSNSYSAASVEPVSGGDPESTPPPPSGTAASVPPAASGRHGDRDAGRDPKSGGKHQSDAGQGREPGVSSPGGPAPRGGASRRRFLTLAVGVGAVAVGAAVAGQWIGARLRDVVADRAGFVVPRPVVPAPPAEPGVRPAVPGLTEFVTPNDRFYRVDTALQLPALTSGNWRLRIHGMVDRPMELDFDELRRRVAVERMITMTCVSNEVGGELAGTAVWTGYPLADLLAEVGVRPEADMLLSRSIDGFTAGTPVSAVTDGRDALLAVGMNGEPLPIAHGYPARLIVPGLYGYVSATKWVIDLELTRFDRAKAYWTERGWGAQALIKTASRIDVPAAFATVPAGNLTVAGVAWAQHRGIDTVEIQVDDQPWQPATLADEYSTDTWRQWTWSWTATPGPHTLRVRATDRSGTVQTDHRTPPFPDGSTGWHSRVITVR